MYHRLAPDKQFQFGMSRWPSHNSKTWTVWHRHHMLQKSRPESITNFSVRPGSNKTCGTYSRFQASRLPLLDDVFLFTTRSNWLTRCCSRRRRWMTCLFAMCQWKKSIEVTSTASISESNTLASFGIVAPHLNGRRTWSLVDSSMAIRCQARKSCYTRLAR